MFGVSKIDAFESVALVSFKKIPAETTLITEIFQYYAEHGINLDMISQTSPLSDRVSISFSCFEQDMVKILSLTKSFAETHPDLRPLVSSGKSKIYIFGEEMRQTPGVFARAMAALSKTTVEPQLITTSEVDISLLVPSVQLEEALDALKAEFQV